MSKARRLVWILALCIFVPVAFAQIMIPAPVESRDWISIIKDLAAPLFYLATIILGIIGLSKWRKELRGRAEFEAAKDVVAGAYRMRDAINNARSMMMFATEWEDREPNPNESDKEKRTSNSLHAYQKRYDRVTAVASQWYPAIVQAEALFGEEGRKKIEALNETVMSLRAAIEMHHNDQISMARGIPHIDEQDFFRKARNIICGIHPGMIKKETKKPELYDDDGFQQGLDSAVREIKEYFSQYIHREKGKWLQKRPKERKL